MRLNSKVTWGLAWTGLAVVLAVPSADFLTGKLNTNSAALITSTTDPVKPAVTGAAPAPVKTASVTTTVTKKGVIITPDGTLTTAPAATPDPVSKYAQSGKPLPDYISGGDQTAAARPAPSTASSAPETQVANVTPQQTVVMPLPRPAAIDKPASKPPVVTPKPATTDPVVTGSLPKATQPVEPVAAKPSAPAVATQPSQPLVIVEDDPAPVQQADVAPDHPIPPAPIEDDSQNWKAQGLSQYLDQNGLMSDDDNQSTATVTVQTNRNYDANGFYLSDGPNRDSGWRAARRARIQRLLNDDGGFQLF